VAAMTDAWIAPQVERTDPGRVLGERQALEAWLDSTATRCCSSAPA
jgi:hypothetical protein